MSKARRLATSSLPAHSVPASRRQLSQPKFGFASSDTLIGGIGRCFASNGYDQINRPDRFPGALQVALINGSHHQWPVLQRLIGQRAVPFATAQRLSRIGLGCCNFTQPHFKRDLGRRSATTTTAALSMRGMCCGESQHFMAEIRPLHHVAIPSASRPEVAGATALPCRRHRAATLIPRRGILVVALADVIVS